MGQALNNPKRPLVAILGGAKVSDKIGVINNLLEKVDTLIVGGGMAYTFFKAQGYGVGSSLCEEDKIDLAKDMLKKAEEKGVKFLLPVDNKLGDKFAEDCFRQDPRRLDGHGYRSKIHRAVLQRSKRCWNCYLERSYGRI